jgi:sugar lactone lactonase YvrE
MGTSNTKSNYSTQNADQPQTWTQKIHAWPESIDIDREDNIYFTDAYAGTLHRLARNEDGTLQNEEEPLIEGLKRASGISISREEHVLYMGFTKKSDQGTGYGIARIPLNIFTKCNRRPYSYEALRVCAQTQQIEFIESEISHAPNGVIFDRDSQTAYYTYAALGWFNWIFKKKGYIGSVRFDPPMEPTIISPIFSPNGIDVEPAGNRVALIVTITLDDSINRVILTDGKVSANIPSSFKKAGSGLLGDLPDGLLRVPNGDLLVAAFGSGKIFYFARQGDEYRAPIEIVQGLGNPTDLTIGLSSDGNGNSLYVTTKKGGLFPWKSISQGRIVEITDIDEKIKSAASQVNP